MNRMVPETMKNRFKKNKANHNSASLSLHWQKFEIFFLQAFMLK